MKLDLYDGDCSISVEGGGSVRERSENTDLRGDGETQGGAKMLLNYRRERNLYIQQSSIHKPSTLPLFNMLSLQYCVFSLLFLYILTGMLHSAFQKDHCQRFSMSFTYYDFYNML